MTQLEWLEKLFKDNENDTYTWKGRKDVHPGTKMQALQDLKREREILKETYKKVTGKDFEPNIPDSMTVIEGRGDDGGGGEKHPALV